MSNTKIKVEKATECHDSPTETLKVFFKAENVALESADTTPTFIGTTRTYIARTRTQYQKFWNGNAFFDVSVTTLDEEVIGANRIVLSELSEILYQRLSICETNELTLNEVDHRTFCHIVELSYMRQVTFPVEDESRFLDAVKVYKIPAVNKDDNERKKKYPYHDLTPDEMLSKFGKQGKDGFLCTVPKCMKFYETKKALKNHLLFKHIEDGVIYICSKCEFPSRNRNGFWSHIARKHPEMKGLSLKDILPEPTFEIDLPMDNKRVKMEE